MLKPLLPAATRRTAVRALLLSLCLVAATVPALRASKAPIPNRAIDYQGFLDNAAEVARLRDERRITEDEFLEMARDPNTIILDARSQEKYNLLHIKGAKNISLPDITAAELTRLIPNKSTRILIYCNNNFENEPIAFPTKVATASLNIFTFNTLYSYGYTNVYELGPFIDIHTSQLPFEKKAASPTP